MNILFITEYKVEPRFGGVQKVTWILTKYLKERKFNVLLLYINENKKNSQVVNEEDHIKQCSLKSERSKDPTGKGNLINIVKSHRIDVIINQCGFNLDVVKSLSMADRPVISVLHSCPNYELIASEIELSGSRSNISVTDIIKRKFAPIYKIYKMKKVSNKLKCIYRESNIIVLLSERYIDSWKRMTDQDMVDKVRCIPNPLEDDYKEQLQTNGRKKIVLYVGRLNSGKRINVLLKIWERIERRNQTWRLHIIGDGPELANLKQCASQRRLRQVIFAGNREDVKSYYARASIFVMTSAYEGVPQVLLEAKANGVVPIVFDSFEAVHDLIIDGVDGYIVPNMHEIEFANRLEELMENNEKLSLMSQKCGNNLEKYACERIGTLWIKLLESLR